VVFVAGHLDRATGNAPEFIASAPCTLALSATGEKMVT